MGQRDGPLVPSSVNPAGRPVSRVDRVGGGALRAPSAGADPTDDRAPLRSRLTFLNSRPRTDERPDAMSTHATDRAMSAITTDDGRQSACGAARGARGGPGGFVVTAAGRPERYRIDEAAFEKWCAGHGEDLDCEIPDLLVEYAGAALSRLAYSALEAEVIVGSPDLRLDVNGDDDSDGPGFYVLLHNADLRTQRIWLTSNWNEVGRTPEGIAAAEAARYYLDEICAIANGIIATMAGAEAGQGFGTWTFMAHWSEADELELEHYVPGEVGDQRIDTGYWAGGLFAESGSAETPEAAWAQIKARYETTSSGAG